MRFFFLSSVVWATKHYLHYCSSDLVDAVSGSSETTMTSDGSNTEDSRVYCDQ